MHLVTAHSLAAELLLKLRELGVNSSNSRSFTHYAAKDASAWAIALEAPALTFVAEWGDRTQIATVTLAAT